LALFLVFIIAAEGLLAAIKGAETSGSSSRTSYAPNKEDIVEAINYIYEQDPDLYRLEMAKRYSTNDPMLYGYRGISQFSSEANSRFANMVKILGLQSDPGSNKYFYYSATPVINALLSVKYIMNRSGLLNWNNIALEKYYQSIDEASGAETNNATAYKNKYWLGIGFMMSEDIDEVEVNNSNPFETQNQIMRYATGIINADVFRNIYPIYEVDESDNVNEARSNYGVYGYSLYDTSKVGKMKLRYNIEKTGQYYVYVKNNRGKTATVVTNYGSYSDETQTGVTIDAGIVYAGEELSVEFEISAGGSGNFEVYVGYFQEENFKIHYDKLSQQVLNVDSWKDTEIKGNITVTEDNNILFVSLPYDKGWHIKVDGVERETNPPTEEELNNPDLEEDSKNKTKTDTRKIQRFTNGFVTIPLESGEHTIELYYVTDGLVMGLTISIISIFIIIIWTLIQKFDILVYVKNRIKKRQKVS